METASKKNNEFEPFRAYADTSEPPTPLEPASSAVREQDLVALKQVKLPLALTTKKNDNKSESQASVSFNSSEYDINAPGAGELSPAARGENALQSGQKAETENSEPDRAPILRPIGK